jgi:hypothetical protein
MVRVFIRDKAPKSLKAFIATISRDGDLGIEDWVLEIAKFDKSLHKGKDKDDDRRKLACQASPSKTPTPTNRHGHIEVCQLCGAPDHGAKDCKRFLGEKRTCYNCGEKGHLSRDCTKPRVPREQRPQYMEAKRAFQAAKKTMKKIGKGSFVDSPSDSSEDGADKESSDSSSESSESSSDDGKFGDHIAVACKQATVIHSKKAIKRASKKGIPTHKTYLEAASPSSSEDSHLSWEDYNAKTAQAGKLTRSRSWDGTMDARLNGESSDGRHHQKDLWLKNLISMQRGKLGQFTLILQLTVYGLLLGSNDS